MTILLPKIRVKEQIIINDTTEINELEYIVAYE